MFTAPVLDRNAPIVSQPFWQWLISKGKADFRKKHCSDLDHVLAYLTEYGFSEGRDVVDAELLDTLLLIFRHFWDICPELSPMNLSEVFTESLNGFYVEGLDYNKRYSAANQVIVALEEAGWVYGVSPSTTYFSVINGKLWAKYQKILGSRCLFEVLPE